MTDHQNPTAVTRQIDQFCPFRLRQTQRLFNIYVLARQYRLANHGHVGVAVGPKAPLALDPNKITPFRRTP